MTASSSSNVPLDTPVLFLVFNRPDMTRRVFEAIRQAQPRRLYIAADGPRAHVPTDKERTEATRAVADQVDWPCDVQRLFRPTNLGCKMAIYTAISWFFEHEPEGIILEDDCLPNASFFRFCHELLAHYRGDLRIWHIGGTNPLPPDTGGPSYYYSKYNRIWGWASWRRAWQGFDIKIPFWPEVKRSGLLEAHFRPAERIVFEAILDKVHRGEIDTWDYQWYLYRLLHGFAVIPSVNLVANIGFGDESTHNMLSDDPLSNLVQHEMTFPLVHPPFFVPDHRRDREWSWKVTGGRLRQLKRKVKGFIK